MNKLEPTYLRYVYDGLNKGFLNAENAAALPQGFIGLFETEFPADISSVERISVLRRLSLWALFKSGVSTHLASEILEEDEEDTKTLIDSYSKWFNSPEPGKYILYHDRLRSYFLQKLSSHELQSLNEKLISYLEGALEANRKDEAEEYALAHLATHMVVESQLDNNYDRLHDFVNQEDIWKRQVKESKEYKWSQQAVQYGIKEGARRHHEMNTLTSTVNSVKLMQEEQNSAQQILDLLNDGDYQTALERALSFDGEKLFTIYILMIHELTFGESKDSSYKKIVYQNLLDIFKNNHADAFPHNIYSKINDLIKFKYIVEFIKMGLDHKILYMLHFNPDSLFKLLENKRIEINEIVKLNLLSYMNNWFVEDYYGGIRLTNLFKTYYKKSDSIDHIFIDEKSGEVFCLRVQMLSLLRYAIESEFSELHKISLESPDIPGNGNLSALADIIFDYDLFDWIQKEELDKFILKDFKNICNISPSLVTMYAELLIGLNRVSEAIKILDPKNSPKIQSTKWNHEWKVDDYINRNNGVYIKMAQYLFTINKKKQAFLIIEQITDQVTKPGMDKAEIYLSIARDLCSNNEVEEVDEFISIARHNMFKVEDVNNKREFYLNEFKCNIDLWILLYNIYCETAEKKEANLAINQAVNLNNKLGVSIFKDFDELAFKYERLGKTCNITYKEGSLKESKRILSESIKAIELLENKKDKEKSIRYFVKALGPNIVLKYKKELLKLIQKYPEQGHSGLPYKTAFNISVGLLTNGFNNTNILYYIIDEFGEFDDSKDLFFWQRHLDKILESTNDQEISDLQNLLKINSDKFAEIIGLSRYNLFYEEINKIKKVGILSFLKDSAVEFFLNHVKSEKLKFSEKYKDILKKEKHIDYYDKEQVSKIVSEVLDKHPNEVEKYRVGFKEARIGFFLSEVIRDLVSKNMYKGQKSVGVIINLIEEKLRNLNILEIKDVDDNMDDLSKINRLIVNLRVNIINDTYTNDEIRQILELRHKLYPEDKAQIYKELAPLLLLKVGSIINVFYILSEEIADAEIQAELYFNTSLRILNNDMAEELQIREKDENKNYITKDKKTEALKMIRLSCRTYLDTFKDGYHKDHYIDKILAAFYELIKQDDIDSVLDITKEYKDLLIIKDKPKDAFANSYGKVIPWNFIYYIYQSICQRLIDKERIEEAFTISTYLLESNQIAKVYFYYINTLLDDNQTESSFKYLEKVIKLIDSESNLACHIEWPQKGYSYLEIADIYIRMSNNKKAQEYITLAILEVESADKSGLIEDYIYTGWGDSYKTIINESNKSQFLCNTIKRLLKIGEVNQSIHLLKEIYTNVYVYIYHDWDNPYDNHDPYCTSLFNIAWKLYENDVVGSLKLIIDDINIEVIEKRKFYTEFFSKMNFKENILTWKHYFKDDIESFILPLSGNFLNNLEVDSDYIYLNNFSEHTKEISNILLAKTHNYLTSKTKPDEEKLNLLSQVIDIDEWRKTSDII